MKYKVEYRDFVIVETDNSQEAVDKVQNFMNSMKNMNENIQSKFFGGEMHQEKAENISPGK